MSNTEKHSIVDYTARIRVSSRKAIGLALLLAKAAPPTLTEGQRRKLAALQETAAAVDSVQAARDRVNNVGIQPLRIHFARGWSALDLALEAAGNVHPSVFPGAERAVHFRAVILPDREFTKLGALEAWTHARRLFGRIEDEGLTAELTEVAGARYLDAARYVTAQLGEALGVGESTRKLPGPNALVEAMDKFTTALSAYARALAADVDENDAASRQWFFDAVAPIDEHRSHSTESGDAEAPATPTDPAIPSPFVT